MTQINLHGKGFKYLVSLIPNPIFYELNELKKTLNCSWEEVVFNLDLLDKLGFSHWSEFYTDNIEYSSFLLARKNIIEIKSKGIKTPKIEAHNLLNQYVLFPTYNSSEKYPTHTIKNGFTKMLVVQEEIGLFSSFSVKDEIFEIEKLRFNYSDCPFPYKTKALYELVYKNNLLTSNKTDTSVVSQRIYIIS